MMAGKLDLPCRKGYGPISAVGITNLPQALISFDRGIPPITLPGLGDIVATSDFMKELDASNFTQLTFAPVLKARIVEYHWEQWDRASEKPAEYPETGEPEDYILARPHSEPIAEQLGDLWERMWRRPSRAH